MSDFSVFETPDPHPYHKAYRELWTKGWVAAMGDSFVVYETLRMHANHKTGLCYPKQSTLLMETGIKSVNTLRKRVDHLIRLGVVQIVKEPTPNTPTEYRVVTAPYLPFYSEDQILTPARGSNIDTREDQILTVRGSNIDTREDQILTPNKNKETRPNNKTHVTTTHAGKISPPIQPPEPTEDSHTITGKSTELSSIDGGQEEKLNGSAPAPRRGVPMTANPRTSNNDPDGLPSSKAAIAELGDKWEGFVDWLVKRSLGWDVADYGATDNLVARAKKIKRSYLVKQWERGNISNLCQQYLEENEAIAQNQSREGGLNERVGCLVELHKTKPLEAVKLAKGDVRIYNKFMKEIVG